MRSLASALPPGESIRTTTAFTSSSFSSCRSVRSMSFSMMPPRPPSRPLPPDVIAMLPVARMSAIGPISLALAGEHADHVLEVAALLLGARAERHLFADRARCRLHRGERVGRVADLVDEPEVLRARRRIRPVLDDVGHARLVSRLRDRIEPRRAHVGEDAGERRARLRARTVARERLLGALELADLEHVDRQVQLVGEQPAHVEDLRGEPHRLDLAGRRHVDARAAAAAAMIVAFVNAVAVAEDLLLLLERLEVLADLHASAPRRCSRCRSCTRTATDFLSSFDLFDDVQQLVEALLPADAAEEARRLLLGHAAAEIEDGDRGPRPARRLGGLAVGGRLAARASLAAGGVATKSPLASDEAPRDGRDGRDAGASSAASRVRGRGRRRSRRGCQSRAAPCRSYRRSSRSPTRYAVSRARGTSPRGIGRRSPCTSSSRWLDPPTPSRRRRRPRARARSSG